MTLSFSDVQCQTTNSPHRDINTASTGAHQSLINTPFSRDPSVPVRCPPDEAQAQSRATTGFQAPMDSRSPVRPINAHTPRSVSTLFIYYFQVYDIYILNLFQTTCFRCRMTMIIQGLSALGRKCHHPQFQLIKCQCSQFNREATIAIILSLVIEMPQMTGPLKTG